MRFSRASALTAIVAAAAVAALFAGEARPGELLDSLSSSKAGSLPKSWKTWPLQRGKASEVYQVAEEGGNRYIKAFDDHDASQQIFFEFPWDVQGRPMLSWRWRATTLPAGAAENNDATNDSACGVYVVVGKYQGHAIKYVWSSQLAPGTVVTRHDGKLKIKVLDSGGGGKWVRHEVDVPSDYEALFGQKLAKDPPGIAILTDGNAVHKPAGCDYADFAIAGK